MAKASITKAEYEDIAKVWVETRSNNATATRTGISLPIVRRAVEEGYPALGLPPIREQVARLAAKPPASAVVHYTLATAFDKSTQIIRGAKDLFAAVIHRDLRAYHLAVANQDDAEVERVVERVRQYIKVSDISKLLAVESQLFADLKRDGAGNKPDDSATADAEIDELIDELRQHGVLGDENDTSAMHDSGVEDELNDEDEDNEEEESETER